jgi:hypothetical protein
VVRDHQTLNKPLQLESEFATRGVPHYMPYQVTVYLKCKLPAMPRAHPSFITSIIYQTLLAFRYFLLSHLGTDHIGVPPDILIPASLDSKNMLP